MRALQTTLANFSGPGVETAYEQGWLMLQRLAELVLVDCLQDCVQITVRFDRLDRNTRSPVRRSCKRARGLIVQDDEIVAIPCSEGYLLRF